MKCSISTQHRIAITGGRGRLARLAAAFLAAQGHEVALFSRKSGDGFLALEELLQPSVMAKYTAILHMAWSSVPFTSEQNPGCEEREDLPLLKKILATLSSIKNGAAPKLIFISSASVYGNTTETPASESSSCKPLSGYARAKQEAEKIILEIAALHPSLEVVILRVTNVIGFPSDPKRPQGILPRIFAAACEQKPLEIWGDGCCSKDYLWIDDFLTALEVSIIKPVQGLFNIASGQNFSIADLVSLVETAFKSSITVTHLPRYAWDVAISRIDATAFSKSTDWRAKVDIGKAIGEKKQ